MKIENDRFIQSKKDEIKAKLEYKYLKLENDSKL
jgi:hypothetical protein